MDVDQKQLIIVGGAPRSGTTLVQNILDTHPEIFGGPEFDRLPAVVNLRNQMLRSVAAGRISQFCDASHVDEAIRKMVFSLLTAKMDGNKARYISEKTPANVLVFEDLHEIFPEARFIFVVRDPRAVVNSMLQVGQRARQQGKKTGDFTRSIYAAIKYAQDCMDAGFKFAEFHREKTYIIRYESLVRNPASETERICAFLGIAWDPGMVHPGIVQHPGESTLDGIFYDRAMYQRDPVTDEVDKWRQYLSPVQQALITRTFGKNDNLSDYRLASPGGLTNQRAALSTFFFDARVRLGRFVLRPFV